MSFFCMQIYVYVNGNREPKKGKKQRQSTKEHTLILHSLSFFFFSFFFCIFIFLCFFSSLFLLSGDKL